MLDRLKKLLHDWNDRENYIGQMTYNKSYRPLWVDLLIIVILGGAQLISKTLATTLFIVVGIPYLIYCLFIWTAAKHRPDDWEKF